MTEQERNETRQEAKILSVLKHPAIVNFREVFTTVTNKLCIVMDFADGGDLQAKIKGNCGKFFTETQILDWFTQICLGLKHVHDRKILHRDIKAQNVFLTSTNRCLLGDFGIAKILSNTRGFTRTMVGTPYYLSPEIIERKKYNFQSDIWSLGVLLYELCALKPPFDGPSLHFLGVKIIKGVYPPISSHYSRELKGLVGQMLMVDPNKRPNIQQILQMNFIQARIKNFLNETQYGAEFCHTILHKVNVLENKENKGEETGVQPKDQPLRLNPLLNAKAVPYQRGGSSAFVAHPNKDRELERMRLERDRLFRAKEKELAEKRAEEAERRRQEEAEKKRAEEMERKRRVEELEKRKQEEIERKRREEAEGKQKEEIERRQREKQKESLERRQLKEIEKKRQEEAERKRLEDLEKKRQEELKRLELEKKLERKRCEELERKKAEDKKRQERREEILKLFPPNSKQDVLALNRPKNSAGAVLNTPISQPLIRKSEKLSQLKANFDKQVAMLKEERKIEVQIGISQDDKLKKGAKEQKKATPAKGTEDKKHSHSPPASSCKSEATEEEVPETARARGTSNEEVKKSKKSSKTKVKSKKKSLKEKPESEPMPPIPEEDEKVQKEANNCMLIRKEMERLISVQTPQEDIIEDCAALAQENNDGDKDRDDMKGILEEEIVTPKDNSEYPDMQIPEQKPVDDMILVKGYLEEMFGEEKVEKIIEKLAVSIYM
eukprot:TRINITY_DN12406_c0_g2_i3.p1 TRINITY_DN12406_c0_g2~~TRINITY_DN12406_c0_g2_i3.p1  ORF type:complete len:723 (-),score=237.47 TRINITY_DN12406_c0_g2_i3:107-2275(-)